MRIFYFIVALICCLSTTAQENKNFHYNKGFVFSPGIIVQSNLFVDANLLYGTVVNESIKIPTMYYQGWRIGIESNLNPSNYTFAPKIGYEYVPDVFNYRLSVVNYFQGDKSEFRILPEIGISIFTWINFNYGYGISFDDQNLRNLGKHRLSITINLNRTLGTW